MDPSDEVRPDTDINGDIGFREEGEPRRHPLAVIGRTKTVLSANAQSILRVPFLLAHHTSRADDPVIKEFVAAASGVWPGLQARRINA